MFRLVPVADDHCTLMWNDQVMGLVVGSPLYVAVSHRDWMVTEAEKYQVIRMCCEHYGHDGSNVEYLQGKPQRLRDQYSEKEQRRARHAFERYKRSGGSHGGNRSTGTRSRG